MRELISIEEHERLRGGRAILWAGGPPPEDDVYYAPLMKLVAAFERTGSLRSARRQAGLLATELDRLLGQSTWLCQQLNAVVNESYREMFVSSVARATGFAVTDPETGKAMEDADGKVIRKGSDVLAKYFFEREERAAGIGVGVGVPMLQAASEDALTAVRRRNGLAQAYPWTTGRPDGSWVLEVGMFNASQVAKLSAYGVELPDIPGKWFVEVAPDRRQVIAVRGQDYEMIERSIGSGEAGADPAADAPPMGLLCDGSDSRGPGGVDIAGRISPPKAGGSRNEEDHADQ